LAGGDPSAAGTRYEFEQVEMAVPIKLIFYAPNSALATSAAQAAFARLRELNDEMTDYDPQSELCRLAATSGGGSAVPVSADLWSVLGTAQKVSELSDGAFDITVGPIVHLWRRARHHHELPPAYKIQEALKVVGYRNVRLDPQRHAVELLKKGMRLDLGGIAKGFALAEALMVLEKKGIFAAMVRGGGDLRLGEPPPNSTGWRIGIAAPDLNAPPTQYLWLSRCAVSNSGDTWQYVVIDGKRYSHIVDPHTGLGLTDRSNVTIVGSDSALVDAMTKVVSVLGPQKGLPLVEAQPGLAALVLRNPAGKVETYRSARWAQLPVAPPGK
jgi:thiamine biosynthesis lipoprotein